MTDKPFNPRRRIASISITVTVLLVIVWFVFIHKTNASLADTVEQATGHLVSCNEVGVMNVAGGRSNVYLCNGTVTSYRGCWADLGHSISDVTKEARAIKSIGGVDLGC